MARTSWALGLAILGAACGPAHLSSSSDTLGTPASCRFELRRLELEVLRQCIYTSEKVPGEARYDGIYHCAEGSGTNVSTDSLLYESATSDQPGALTRDACEERSALENGRGIVPVAQAWASAHPWAESEECHAACVVEGIVSLARAESTVVRSRAALESMHTDAERDVALAPSASGTPPTTVYLHHGGGANMAYEVTPGNYAHWVKFWLLPNLLAIGDAAANHAGTVGSIRELGAGTPPPGW